MTEVQGQVTGEVHRWPTMWGIQDARGDVYTYSTPEDRDAYMRFFEGPVRLVTIPGTDALRREAGEGE